MHRSRFRDRSGRGGTGFSPLSLFSNGEQGAWYDPSDLSSLFQDAAGTTPVTAADQQVGLMRDKSGRGNHASQSTAASRPILRTSGGIWYLEFDGANDFMVTPTINFTNQSEMSVFVGGAKITDAAPGVMVELSPDINTNNFAFAILAPSSAATGTYRAQFKGTLLSECLASGYPAPNTAVISAICSIGFSQFMRVSGALTNGDSLQGTGNFGNYPMYLGMRAGATVPFRGYMAGLVVRGKFSDAATITATESYLARKAGVSF